MFIRVYGILGVNFERKKAPRSSRRVLGFWSHGPTGCKMGSLWIRFPVWRELKPAVLYHRHTNIDTALDTLSRLKGIETFIFSDLDFLFSCNTLDTLSRLKGIETQFFCDDQSVVSIATTLDTLSRLKGIETFTNSSVKSFCLSLDTLSRLKGIETWGTI